MSVCIELDEISKASTWTSRNSNSHFINNLAPMKIKWFTCSVYKNCIDQMIGLVSELVVVARDSEVVPSYYSVSQCSLECGWFFFFIISFIKGGAPAFARERESARTAAGTGRRGGGWRLGLLRSIYMGLVVVGPLTGLRPSPSKLRRVCSCTHTQRLSGLVDGE